ncbi:unnamed protein product [Paramecium octaurelia]|uniref:Uncharacterized protein n=1 Tax=Paramecium octaurelia TaxID=43137 RepID=A0A8S1SRV8_PAROT|nr:unnamed protein product [Paramecium octaurelia]
MSRNHKDKPNTQEAGQKLKQEQLQKVDQIQREIQHYIYKDLENTLIMLGELEQTIETFKYAEEEGKSYLPIACNKVILQANLSYGINYDQYNTNKNTHAMVFEECSKDAIKIFEEVFETNEDGQKKVHAHPIISEICQFYKKKDFKNNKEFQQLPLQKVDRKAQFNENCLDKVIGGIRAVDQQFNDTYEKPYPIPTAEELKKKIQERKKFCEEQLIKNFKLKNPIQSNSNQDVGQSKEDNDDKVQIEEDKQMEEQKTDIQAQNNQDTLEGIQQGKKDNMETEIGAKDQEDTNLPIQDLQRENTAPGESNFGKLGPKPQGISGDMDVEQGLDDENGHQKALEEENVATKQHK